MAGPHPQTPTYPPLPLTLLLISTKAYFSPSRTITYLESLLDPTNNILPTLQHHHPHLLFALLPDHLTLYPCAQILKSHALLSPAHSTLFALGAQDCHPSTTYGALTGCIVPPALVSLGVTIVEIGHAERRGLLHEDDTSTAAKAAAITACRMVPLVCVGEVDPPPASGGPLSMVVGNALRQLTPQITSVLHAMPADAPLILAYEPVWAIGKQEPAGVDYVGPVVQAIREVVKSSAPGRTAETRVVYGGSAGPGLWSGKKNGGNGLRRWVDGMFLGRFAHEVGGVREVVEEVVKALEADASNK